jgi:hypothetical protein
MLRKTLVAALVLVAAACPPVVNAQYYAPGRVVAGNPYNGRGYGAYPPPRSYQSFPQLTPLQTVTPSSARFQSVTPAYTPLRTVTPSGINFRPNAYYGNGYYGPRSR